MDVVSCVFLYLFVWGQRFLQQAQDTCEAEAVAKKQEYRDQHPQHRVGETPVIEGWVRLYVHR